MEINIIIYLSLTFIITSFCWFIYVGKLKNNYSILKNNYDNFTLNLEKEVLLKTGETHKTLENTIADLRFSLSEEKHKSYLEGYEKAKNEFSIQVFPYKEEHTQGDNGWFVNDIFHEVIIGYKYQLFINGIPLLQPAIVIEEILTEEKREVDYNKVRIALEVIETKLLTIIGESKGLIKLIKNKK